MSVPLYTWWLPRPRRDHYKGSFPLYFERKLLQLLGAWEGKAPKPDVKILHPFGGKAEYGIRCDQNPECKADFAHDAHALPADWTEQFDIVILDPPYDEGHAKRLYKAKKPRFGKYMAEAVRVCKPGGFVVHYHWYLAPRPEGCAWWGVVSVITRVFHKARVVSIFKKEAGPMPVRGSEDMGGLFQGAKP